MHTNVKSLGCTPDTNIMSYVSYTSIKKKKNIMVSVTCEQVEGNSREAKGRKHKARWPMIGTPNGQPRREGQQTMGLFVPLHKGNEEGVCSPMFFLSFGSVSVNNGHFPAI